VELVNDPPMRQEPVVADAIKAVAEVFSHLENLVNLQRFPFLFDGVVACFAKTCPT
jgi:hypothetical protein